jgi:hypothetical protein
LRAAEVEASVEITIRTKLINETIKPAVKVTLSNKGRQRECETIAF